MKKFITVITLVTSSSIYALVPYSQVKTGDKLIFNQDSRVQTHEARPRTLVFRQNTIISAKTKSWEIVSPAGWIPAITKSYIIFSYQGKEYKVYANDRDFTQLNFYEL